MEQLKKRSLDQEPYLSIALGAAIEVEAQVLVARGQRAGAITYLYGELKKYAPTGSIAKFDCMAPCSARGRKIRWAV